MKQASSAAAFELMLVRHAKSDWHNSCPDAARPLNQRGQRDADAMGQHLSRLQLIPQRMIVSSAQRAQQTATILLRHLALPDKRVITDKTLYLAARESLLELAETYARPGERLMLIAHNPGMDDAVEFLANRPPTYSASGKLMATCAVAHFQLDVAADLKAPGGAHLLNLFRPKEIAGQ